MRLEAAVSWLFFALAACAPPAPRADTQGEAVRRQVDGATKAYAGCVTAATGAIDVSGETAGSLALSAMKSCAKERTALIGLTAKFWLLGHPAATPAKADYQQRMSVAVAEASVQTIEDDMRSQAVVDIVKRQTPADRAKVNP